MTTRRKKLPALISVPHGGTFIPEHLRSRCLLTDLDVALDGDTWTKQLFNFRGLTEEFLVMEAARIVVDLNREPTDRPPENPDGVVKTLTVTGKRIWEEDLTASETDELIHQWYEPYHEQLMNASLNPAVKIAFDCHTMLDVGPAKGKREWEARPLFCISNRGITGGEAGGETVTAEPELMQRLKELLEETFVEEADHTVPLVAVNEPFFGGFITRSHGKRSDIPWIQLEINRRLYLPETAGVLPSEAEVMRMNMLRNKLYEVFMQLTAEEVPAPVDEKSIS
ncbi:N-formylglutamate amidohydrolase [Alkalicoccus halolimnae]|uniref:N-formylglutamate amidohydrolase n=1 Tax=Alkalicoccus halolimnae TaxID=1667239 RepID=A0A5C7F8W8_9BACI|nr:N-formylglutamate amidohydrolase [Alkalicoccus halolimnae]TXF86040.1 N-formylglutamate amidohydrolase [Alkalicoccus halolimnae]